MKKLLFLCTCLAFAGIAHSQTEDKKWNIGLHGGVEQYQGDLGNGFYKANQAVYGFGGISLSRYIISHLDASLMFTKGEVGYVNDTAHFNTGFSTVTLNIRLQILGPKSPVRPYLFAGA